jgi:hypothetical protein
MNTVRRLMGKVAVLGGALLTLNSVWAQPAIVESVVPQYVQGRNGTNSQRIPCAYWVRVSGLAVNATYRYYNQVVRSSDSQTTNGAGNVIFANSSGFVRTTSPGLSSAGSYGELTADAEGAWSGWMITEPTGNARFVPGQFIFFRIMLNDGAGGTSVATRLTTTDSVRVLMLGTTLTDSTGTGIRGNTLAAPRDFVLLYDHTSGIDRPLSATFVESDGSENSTANSYIAFYADSVHGIDGAFGAILPNANDNGVRRVERRSLSGSILAFNQNVNGIWPSGANTVNPTGGATPIVLTVSDAPLNSSENSPPSISLVSRNPLAPVANSPVTVSARITDSDGSMFSTTLLYDAGSGFQTVTLYDDGLHGDSAAGDHRFGGNVPGQPALTTVFYYLEAVDNASATVRYPSDAPTHLLSYLVDRPQPKIVINEFMAQNTATLQDPTGEWADWVELFNAGHDTVDLEGLALTDNFANLRKWTMPDTSITPGGVLLIWCDEDEDDPGLHANFKLSSSGEQIALSDLADYGGAVLDSLTFGPQTADTSYARLCDGGPVWDFDSTPTPNARNGICEPLSLTVWVSAGDVCLRWRPSPGAQEYYVYRLLNAGDPVTSGTLAITVADTTATLSGEVSLYTKAFYAVTAVSE